MQGGHLVCPYFSNPWVALMMERYPPIDADRP
jgi:hypothetical protein